MSLAGKKKKEWDVHVHVNKLYIVTEIQYSHVSFALGLTFLVSRVKCKILREIYLTYDLQSSIVFPTSL